LRSQQVRGAFRLLFEHWRPYKAAAPISKDPTTRSSVRLTEPCTTSACIAASSHRSPSTSGPFGSAGATIERDLLTPRCTLHRGFSVAEPAQAQVESGVASAGARLGCSRNSERESWGFLGPMTFRALSRLFYEDGVADQLVLHCR
jgi:hypothetical protein